MQQVRTASATADMRLAVVEGRCYYPILRIDTNQGIYGLGEVRDGGHAENALQFKHMLIGQNPCNVDFIFKTNRRFCGGGRGTSADTGHAVSTHRLLEQKACRFRTGCPVVSFVPTEPES
jgi:L-alanine-DL-glutamate epimerase-like enolase superfamily enzyme